MLQVALWEPEIPPNAGNVARLCAATGTRLHLIGRLGFRLDDKTLKRAGLDYWPHVDWVRHATFAEFEALFPLPPVLREEKGSVISFPLPPALRGERGRGEGGSDSSHLPINPPHPDPLPPKRGERGQTIWCIETPSPVPYTRAVFRDGDCLLFGSESKGLPADVRVRYAATTIGIPMPAGKVRSLNLATAAGIVLYEALRQLHGW